MAQQELKLKISSDVAQGVNGIKQFNKEIAKVPNASGAATNSLINLSRVAQDAPFGFIGIANNINPLLESFQRLQKETGSTKLSLQALGASMLGGGGLGLAIGVITSLLTVFSMSHHKSKEKVDEHKKAVDEAAEAQKAYTEATDHAAASVIRESAHLEDLKQLFISTSSELGKLTEATIKQGVAQFVFDQKNEAIQKLLSSQVQLAIQTKKTNSILASVPEVTSENFSKNPLIKQIGEAQTEIKKLNGLGEGLENVLNDIFNKQFSKKEREVKVKVKPIKERPFLLPVEPELPSPQKIQQIIGKDLNLSPVLLPVIPDLKKDALLLDIASNRDAVRQAGNKLGGDMANALGEVFQNKVNAAIAKGLSVETLQKFQEALKTTIVIGVQLADTLGSAFGAFGAALVQGQNAMQAFFTSIKNSLSQIIGQLLKTIATAAILSAITGGVGGGGLSFVGALKSLLSVKPFAKGGLAFGPTLGLVGEGKNINRSNPEVISPLSDLKKFIGGGQTAPAYLPVHEISGDTLRLWYKRANDSGRMFG